MAFLDGSPVAPFIPGGAEMPRISLENPTTTIFVSQVEVCCCVEIEAVNPCSPQILLWPGDGNQMESISKPKSVLTFPSALVVTLEVPTLEDLRSVLATSVLSCNGMVSDCSHRSPERQRYRTEYKYIPHGRPGTPSRPLFPSAWHQPSSRPRCLAATQCYASRWPASQSCPPGSVPLGSQQPELTNVPPYAPSHGIHP
ncbi:hypothetical protein NEUTE2DRAFT_56782 [Neurospora tetrasperma FGSC 2509]|nr:hypothetical protein NEUTE2DRAFT_56782 [Neurospora tetrasperma FGSC 2509]